MPKDVVGAREIAEMLGVRRQRVTRLAARDPIFPKPWKALAMDRLWVVEAVRRWAKATGGRSSRSPDEVPTLVRCRHAAAEVQMMGH